MAWVLCAGVILREKDWEVLQCKELMEVMSSKATSLSPCRLETKGARQWSKQRHRLLLVGFTKVLGHSLSMVCPKLANIAGHPSTAKWLRSLQPKTQNTADAQQASFSHTTCGTHSQPIQVRRPKAISSHMWEGPPAVAHAKAGIQRAKDCISVDQMFKRLSSAQSTLPECSLLVFNKNLHHHPWFTCMMDFCYSLGRSEWRSTTCKKYL